MEVIVFGAGSLGSLFGALLASDHDVTLVGRDPHVSAVRSKGLAVTGLNSFTVHPAATVEGSGLHGDLAIVTVKSFDTATAARALATGTYEAVLSLQNGMGNEDTLADILDCPVLAGTTTYGARLREPGIVEWTGRGEVVIGPWTPSTSPTVDRVARAFARADLDVSTDHDMRTRLWEKLAVNAAINPTTALARVPNGALATGGVNEIARSAARETARTARADGATITTKATIDHTEDVIAATAANHSSMFQDVAAGRRTEIDAITGHVVDRAAAGAIDVPVNRTLLGLVRGWERDRGLRVAD